MTRSLQVLFVAIIPIVTALTTNANAKQGVQRFQCASPIAGLLGQALLNHPKGMDDASRNALVSVIDCLAKPHGGATPKK